MENESTDEKDPLWLKIFAVVFFTAIGLYWIYLNVAIDYDSYCLIKRLKFATGKVVRYGNYRGTLNCTFKYKFNDKQIVEARVSVFENEYNRSCYGRSYINCKGDTITVGYDSLDYKNCYIVGRSPKPKREETYLPLFEWYERNFVPKEKWCVCEEKTIIN